MMHYIDRFTTSASVLMKDNIEHVKLGIQDPTTRSNVEPASWMLAQCCDSMRDYTYIDIHTITSSQLSLYLCIF